MAPGAQWCSLCFTPVEAATNESVGPPSGVIPAARAPAEDPPPRLDRPPLDQPPPVPTASADGLSADPDAWAARLAAEEGSRSPGYVSTLSRPGARVLLGVGGAVALLAICLAAFALLAKVTS